MSLYRVTVAVASLWDVALLPNHDASPAHVSLSLDADAICALLAQAFEQELSVAYIERFLTAYKAEVVARDEEGVGR
jgi:hypothetical protein